ncbi:hypothetical protein ACJX0J_010631, partial [Zea mays]
GTLVSGFIDMFIELCSTILHTPFTTCLCHFEFCLTRNRKIEKRMGKIHIKVLPRVEIDWRRNGEKGLTSEVAGFSYKPRERNEQDLEQMKWLTTIIKKKRKIILGTTATAIYRLN